MRQNSKKKSRKSAKSLYQNNTISCNNQNTPKLHTSISNENTIIFHRTQNKSPLDGAAISCMGTMMNSFGPQSATSTWIKQEKKENSPRNKSKHSGSKKLRIDYAKHLKLDPKDSKHYKKKDKTNEQI